MRTAARPLTAALITASLIGVALAGCVPGVSDEIAVAGPSPTVSTPSGATPSAIPSATPVVLTADNIVPALAGAMVEAGSVTTTTRTVVDGVPVVNVMAIDLDAAQLRVQLTQSQGTVELVAMRGQKYVKGPTTGGKYYVVPQKDNSYAPLVSSADPVRPIRAIFGAVLYVHAAGEPAMLEGVPAQPYTVIVDTARLRDGLGDLGAGVPREQLPPTITLTYWVDASARLLRATSDFARFPVDMTFTGWGADLGIVAPPEDQQTLTLPS